MNVESNITYKLVNKCNEVRDYLGSMEFVSCEAPNIIMVMRMSGYIDEISYITNKMNDSLPLEAVLAGSYFVSRLEALKMEMIKVFKVSEKNAEYFHDEMSNIIETLDPCIKILDRAQKEENSRHIAKELFYQYPSGVLPTDVSNIINLSFQESIMDFINECYTSSVAMCGKTIETVLSALLKEVTGEDADKQNPPWGWEAIANRLKKQKGYEFKGIGQQSEFIKLHRNKAVHGSIVIPTRDEAFAVLSFTRDVLIKSASKIK